MPPVPTLRQSLPYAAFGAFVVMWMAATLPAWNVERNDFGLEAWPAYQLLMAGDFDGYVAGAPGYLTFTLLVGTPAALLAEIGFDSSPRALSVLLAVPGALILGGVAGWLAAYMRSTGRRAWLVVLLVAAGVVLGRNALRFGHPEDLLATGGAVGGVLLALHGRVNAAMALLVVGVLAKQWAVLAILPAALAAPRHRWRLVLVTGGAAILTVWLQMALHPLANATLTSTGDIFYQRTWWYPLGGPAAPGSHAAEVGMLAPPGWLVPLSHPLIIAIAAPLCALWWYVSRDGKRPANDVLGLLALLLLLRCTLDPWNTFYYHLPLVLALVSWEVLRGARLPWLSILTVAAVMYTFPEGWQNDHSGSDEYARYLAWTLPLFMYLVVRVYGGPRALPHPMAALRARRDANRYAAARVSATQPAAARASAGS